MPTLRISLAVFAFLLFSGWLWLRKPYSPTDDLPMVAFTAFELQSPDTIIGATLANTARSWPGVTASTYNSTSGLVAVGHEITLSEKDLQAKLQSLSPIPVSKKTFTVPPGPKCPVPQQTLAALPGWFLIGGIISGLGFILLVFVGKKRKSIVYTA